MKRPLNFKQDTYDVHYEVEGRTFSHATAAFRVAVELYGYTGTEHMIRTALKHGVNTWAELLKPNMHPSHVIEAARKRMHEMNEKSHAEIAAAIEAIDKRKRELKLRR